MAKLFEVPIEINVGNESVSVKEKSFMTLDNMKSTNLAGARWDI